MQFLREGVRHAARSVLEVIYPTTCVLCGIGPPTVDFTPDGDKVRGLRWCDRSSLCVDCVGGLAPHGPVATGRLPCGLPVVAATMTGHDLVRVVGAFKYHGVRGLAWPLASMLTSALPPTGGDDCLVPLPLHRRRRRVRGFNQAALLARLVAARRGLDVAAKVLVRVRTTSQQAAITDHDLRYRNVAGAFRAREHDGRSRGAWLVDDLVTSGATVGSAATALRERGWALRGVLALGLADRSESESPSVDTVGVGF